MLLGLVGRLYQVEAPSGDSDNEAPAREKRKKKRSDDDEGEDGDADGGPREGEKVVLVGLKKQQLQYNGQVGTVVKSARAGKRKFHVEVQGAGPEETESIKVKGAEHLVPVAPPGTPLVVGAKVAICGLRNHTELNGCLGHVEECHAETHRFEVRAIDGGQLFRVKPENLVALAAYGVPPADPAAGPAPGAPAGPAAGSRSPTARPGSAGPEDDEIAPGAIVQLVDLKTAMCYNGEHAEVIAVDAEQQRYQIRLSDGSVKKIRKENAKLVRASSKSAPQWSDSGKRKATEASLKPGSRVQLTGLRSAAQLNGQRAQVLQDLGDRAEVQLEDGSVKKVRKDNVELVGAGAP